MRVKFSLGFAFRKERECAHSLIRLDENVEEVCVIASQKDHAAVRIKLKCVCERERKGSEESCPLPYLSTLSSRPPHSHLLLNNTTAVKQNDDGAQLGKTEGGCRGQQTLAHVPVSELKQRGLP